MQLKNYSVRNARDVTKTHIFFLFCEEIFSRSDIASAKVSTKKVRSNHFQVYFLQLLLTALSSKGLFCTNHCFFCFKVTKLLQEYMIYHGRQKYLDPCYIYG